MSREKKEQKGSAYDLRAVLEEIELDLIRNLRRNLKRHEKEEEKEGFRWEMWQKAKLRNIAVVLQIKRATDLQIILAINRLLWTFLSHCNETVLHIAGIRNPPMQINCTGGFPDKAIKTVARLF